MLAPVQDGHGSDRDSSGLGSIRFQFLKTKTRAKPLDFGFGPVFVPYGSLAVFSNSNPGLGLDESDHQFNSVFVLKIYIKTHIKYYNNVDVPIIIIVEISCLSIVIKIVRDRFGSR